MRWLNEPREWSFANGTLSVHTDPCTDFWRGTHYGYVRDSGHLFGRFEAGNARLLARVEGAFCAQYDQAGLMARVDPEHWVKAGIEWYEDRLRLSTVTTVQFSSWVFTDLPSHLPQIWLQMRRSADAVEISYSGDGQDFVTTALAYLPPHRATLPGLASAAPEGPGFPATFENIVFSED